MTGCSAAPFTLPFDGVCGLASTGAIAGMSTAEIEKERNTGGYTNQNLDKQRASSPLRAWVECPG